MDGGRSIDHQHCFLLLITFFKENNCSGAQERDASYQKHGASMEESQRGKFFLSSRKVEQPNGGIREYPCYSLTKTYELLHLCAANNGGEHKNVMRAIRNMEPAWEKVHGRKFALKQRTISQHGRKLTG